MLLFLNLILIGFVVGLTTLIVLDRKAFHTREKAFDQVCSHLLDVRKDVTQAFKFIKQANANQNKVMKIVRAADNAIKQSFVNIDHDIEHLFMLQKATNQALKDGMNAHNELTDIVFDNFKEVWCDLSCDECDECLYADRCENMSLDPTGEQGEPCQQMECIGPSLGDTPMNNLNSPKGVMTVTPDENGEEKIKILRDRMRSSGVPENIIDQFVDKVEKLISSNSGVPITLVWDSLVPNKEIQRCEAQKKEFNKDKVNKMVDPNSKIVKSLNRIFELPSSDK